MRSWGCTRVQEGHRGHGSGRRLLVLLTSSAWGVGFLLPSWMPELIPSEVS